MIAVRLFSLAEIKQLLKQYNCELIETFRDDPSPGFGQYYFRTAWGQHFYVPGIGPDLRCPEERMFQILTDLARLAQRASR